MLIARAIPLYIVTTAIPLWAFYHAPPLPFSARDTLSQSRLFFDSNEQKEWLSINKPQRWASPHKREIGVSQLQAFKLKNGQTSNMFEGPVSLTRERDACGVGFIANTKSGGKFARMTIA